MSTRPEDVVPAVTVAPEDDLEAGYQNRRSQLMSDAAVDAMESYIAPEQPTDEITNDAVSRGFIPSRRTGAGGNMEPSTGRKVANDLARGIVEIPRAGVVGVRDAVANLFGIADEFDAWMSEMTGSKPSEVNIHDFIQGLVPIEDPKSTTGGVVKGIGQFIVGMIGASRLIQSGGYLASTAKGGMSLATAFEPAQERLSNLIEQYPQLSNPVTRFLAADPEDSAAEGRLKNALEGMAIGAVSEGFLRGLKLLKRGITASRATAGAEAEQVQQVLQRPRELADDAFKALGDERPNAAFVKLKPSPASLDDVLTAKQGEGVTSAASSAAGRAQQPPETFINFARIDTPDDVKRVMQRLSDVGTTAKDSAKAGARSFAQVKLDAVHEDAWTSLMTRRAGQPLTDAQTQAARELWAATTDKVAQLAEVAVASPSEANLFAFRKMLDVHDLVQSEVLGARASAARALTAWRIPVGTAAERLQSVQAALEASGGGEVAHELAARVSALANAGQITQLSSFVQKGAYARTRDAVLEAWINGLLSNPATHVANTVSNTSVAVLRMAERAVAAQINRVLGIEGGVAAGEAAAQWHGAVQGGKELLRYWWKLAQLKLTRGAGELVSPVEQHGLRGTKLEYTPSISSQQLALNANGWLGRSVDFAGSTLQRYGPGRALQLEDDIFKTIGYRMELQAQAVRQATNEVTAGKLAESAFATRVAQLVETPSEAIRLAAVDAATYQTFTNAPGELAKSIGRLTHQYPALKVLLPFTRTPANILTFTFERTPLAPLMSRFRANIAAGGARRDLALTQMGLGTLVMLASADAVMSGQVSGRGPRERGINQAMRRAGWQPYSVKLGDRWFTYNRLDPIGSLIGMSADATELLMQAQHEALDDSDTEKLAVATALAFAGNITNKTYLSGLSSAIEALNDPQRAAQSWAERTVGSIVPAGVAGIERIQDPTVREVYSMMDAIRARTPGLSDSLPPRLDLWGEPVSYESGLGKPFDFFSPSYSGKENPEPIDTEIMRLESNIPLPSRRTSFNGVTVTLPPDAYSRYVELSGNGIKSPAWGMGAKDYLNAVVTNNHAMSLVYNMRSDGPDGGKDAFIRSTITDYRALARDQLLKEFPELKAEVDEKQRRKRELRLPVFD